MKILILLLALLTTPTFAQPFSVMLRSTVASGETSNAQVIGFDARVNRIAVSVPATAGSTTATLTISGPWGQYVTIATIAENTTTYFDSTDFDAGLDYLHIGATYRIIYTLTNATDAPEVITTYFFGEEYP